MTRHYGQWMRVLRGLSSGALMLGLVQAFGALNFNQIWFQFIAALVSLLATALFGAQTTTTV